MSNVAPSPGLAIEGPNSAFSGLAPLFLVIFFGFLAVGIPLPALSLYVRGDLGFNAVWVGWVVGIQSLATVMTRHRAGTVSDHRGPRRAVLLGLPMMALAGLFYLASTWHVPLPAARLGLLVTGRLLMGLGESLFITGAMSWGMARLGAARTGKVMAWQGIAMYAALGVGAPIGLGVQAASGFIGVAVVTVATTLLAGVIALCIPATPAGGGHRVPFHRVLALIWRPGLILGLATVPFAAMATFLALDFAAKGWSDAGLALAGFAAGYIGVRLFGAHLPDRLGGVRIAAGSLAVEALGQAVLWLAPDPGIAVVGTLLTGIGFSLIFPSMGIEATRRVAPDQRGRAVGNFIAFFDLALGATGPLVGLAAGGFGYGAAFLMGTAATLAALALLPALRRTETPG